MIEDVISKIKIKRDELDALQSQLKRERRELFDSMVGRYYKTAATCLIMVERIDSVDSEFVYVDGLVAYVNHPNLCIEVNFCGMAQIRIINIASSEITKEEFLDVVMKNIEALKEKLIASDK